VKSTERRKSIGATCCSPVDGTSMGLKRANGLIADMATLAILVIAKSIPE
jgi:hypothetical protein